MEMFKALLAKANVDPKLIDEVVVGNVRNEAGAYNVRAAALAAGIPNTAPTLVGECPLLQNDCAMLKLLHISEPLLQQWSDGDSKRGQPDPSG
jgi:hypothetical protein